MIYYPSVRKYRDIVQSVERWSPKPNVEGSSPSVPVGASDLCPKLFLCYTGKKLRKQPAAGGESCGTGFFFSFIEK